VRADGSPATDFGGAGSGGVLSVSAGRFAGNGVFSAEGGPSDSFGGEGGGGLVMISVLGASTNIGSGFRGEVSVARGRRVEEVPEEYRGSDGALYLPGCPVGFGLKEL
jgi:hypothetical protein